jgi:CRISPR-associated protein Cmr4
MKQHLLTLYTRTPLHVGSGTSVEVVDLPIMRERITNFPVIPGTSLKGVLRQACEDDGALGTEAAARLFGAESKADELFAGCVLVSDAKLLAFPVRSLAGCFAWLTCPLALRRFQRDSGRKFAFPEPDVSSTVAGSDLVVPHLNEAVFEEYALKAGNGGVDAVAEAIDSLCADDHWKQKLKARLAIIHDETFQHFVSTATEITTRIKINPNTRTVDEGALFNQENVPSETLFYSALLAQKERSRNSNGWTDADVSSCLQSLLPAQTVLQIGGDETTGHGFCSVNLLMEERP